MLWSVRFIPEFECNVVKGSINTRIRMLYTVLECCKERNVIVKGWIWMLGRVQSSVDVTRISKRKGPPSKTKICATFVHSAYRMPDAVHQLPYESWIAGVDAKRSDVTRSTQILTFRTACPHTVPWVRIIQGIHNPLKRRDTLVYKRVHSVPSSSKGVRSPHVVFF